DRHVSLFHLLRVVTRLRQRSLLDPQEIIAIVIARLITRGVRGKSTLGRTTLRIMRGLGLLYIAPCFSRLLQEAHSRLAWEAKCGRELSDGKFGYSKNFLIPLQIH